MAKNYTIAGVNDGFGSQYLKKMGGFSLCAIWPSEYNYIHTPFRRLDHLSSNWVPKLNEFIGIPNNSRGRDGRPKTVHVRQPIYRNAHREPNKFFNKKTMDMLRDYYWSTEKPDNGRGCKTEICIHIRRGDLHLKHVRSRDLMAWAHKRMTSNAYYKENIPKILRHFSDEAVTIHTDGKPEEFQEIVDEWGESLNQRVFWKFNVDIRNTFHDMVTCKRLFLARSSISYAAALLNDNREIYFQNGPSNLQTSNPLDFWKNWNTFENESL
ncbi:MAG: hypothetical protein CL833_01745 [Crocinitomicaceae bacterium]|nr:hypothetical protein [Crocinitomicaceae bacterium]